VSILIPIGIAIPATNFLARNQGDSDFLSNAIFYTTVSLVVSVYTTMNSSFYTAVNTMINNTYASIIFHPLCNGFLAVFQVINWEE
jgi:hypothetical protein